MAEGRILEQWPDAVYKIFWGLSGGPRSRSLHPMAPKAWTLARGAVYIIRFPIFFDIYLGLRRQKAMEVGTNSVLLPLRQTFFPEMVNLAPGFVRKLVPDCNARVCNVSP